MLRAQQPDTFGEQLWNHIGATPGGLVGAVIAAVGIYLVFLILIRIVGPRILQGMHTFDTIVVLMLGGVCARVTLGNEPTILTGIVVLGTLLIMEAIFGKVRDTVRGSRLLNSPPTPIIVDGELNETTMRKLHITKSELASVMRRQGLHKLSDVKLLVLEPNGQFSVIRTDTDVESWIVDGVQK